MSEYKYAGFYNKGEEIVEFHYNVDLNAESKVRFVATLTNMLVGDHYNLIIRDMLFNYCVISEFTDIDLNEVNNSKNAVYTMEQMFEQTDMVDRMLEVIDESLIEELNYAVDKDVEYKTGVRVNSLEDSLEKLISALNKKLSGADVQGAIQNMLNGMSPEKVVEAYMKSDIFKKRNEEIAKAKEQNKKSGKTKLEVIQ